VVGEALGDKDAAGVLGESDVGYGVYGTSDNGIAVRGDAETLPGVVGESVNAEGVLGAGALAGIKGVGGDIGVCGQAMNGVGVVGQSQKLAGLFIGRVYVWGPFTVFGVKSAAVPHPDGSHRLLYTMESPESWFEDFGEAKLENGRAKVRLDPEFAAVVKTGSYHVFVTPYSNSNGLYVSNRRGKGLKFESSGLERAERGFPTVLSRNARTSAQSGSAK